MYSYGPPHMAGQKQDDQHIHSVTMWGYGMLSRRPAGGDER